MANLKITLVKSLNGRLEKHIATAASLGLRKIGQTVVREDTPANRGYVRAVAHLVKVEEIDA